MEELAGGKSVGDVLEQANRETLLESDKRVFQGHLETWGDYVYRFVFSRVWHAETAQDMVQEVYLKWWAARAIWGDVKNPRAWLLAVATNLIRDWKRSAYQWRREPDLSSLDLLRAKESPEAPLFKEEQNEQLNDAIEGLPQQQKDVAIAVVYRSMSHREIADEMGMTGVAVEACWRRAKKKLQQKLLEQGHEGRKEATGDDNIVVLTKEEGKVVLAGLEDLPPEMKTKYLFSLPRGAPRLREFMARKLTQCQGEFPTQARVAKQMGIRPPRANGHMQKGLLWGRAFLKRLGELSPTIALLGGYEPIQARDDEHTEDSSGAGGIR